MMRYAAVAAALVFLGACDLNILGPEVRFENRLQLNALREYEIWYRAVEACRSSRGDYAGIRWFVADEIFYDGVPVAAHQSDGRITIRSDFVAYEQIVRHEADHHVTGRDNSLHLPDGTTACDGSLRPAHLGRQKGRKPVSHGGPHPVQVIGMSRASSRRCWTRRRGTPNR